MEIILVALRSLHANKLRSLLTILGIIVGIFSIITISTIVSMLQNSIEEGVSQLGQTTFQIQKYPAMMDRGDRAKFRNRKDITYEQFTLLREKLLGEAQAVGAEQWEWGKQFTFGNKQTNPNVQLVGCTPDAFPNNKWIAEYGRSFNTNELDRNDKIIVLGKTLAETLFEGDDPIGQEVKVDNRKLKVIGVLEKQATSFGNDKDNFAAIPITTFQGMYGKYSESVNITVSSFGKEDYDDVIEKAVGYFRTIRKVPAGEEDDFGIFSNESVLNQINSMTAGVKIGAYVIALIALLAAGIGIMNIMLVSVTERTKEIGIRKAIGAKKLNILVQFLIEAVVLSLLGGFVGIAIGLIVGNLAGSAIGGEFSIPLDWVAIGVLLCIIVGVGFGTYPAYKASNLDPIDALRYE
ncbi:MAG: ABC transporter permease [Ignavibacteriales bacterium]|nr:ABC transporter permease [Ignavibacteriales bacterium]MCB9209676.1 ABC transporter permease [Ignavibacteriales bacterium]MCB9218832.1 ABC transporter permease [Ignavibacteriales bacterium]